MVDSPDGLEPWDGGIVAHGGWARVVVAPLVRHARLRGGRGLEAGPRLGSYLAQHPSLFSSLVPLLLVERRLLSIRVAGSARGAGSLSGSRRGRGTARRFSWFLSCEVFFFRESSYHPIKCVLKSTPRDLA